MSKSHTAWIAQITALVAAFGSTASAAPAADYSRTAISFGYQTLHVPSPAQPVFVTNVGDAPLSLDSAVITGSRAQDYSVAGTCVPPTALAPGERCRLDVVLDPLAGLGHPTTATLTVTTNGMPATQDIALAGVVDPGNATVQPTSLFVPTPGWLDFTSQAVGTSSAPLTLAIQDVSVLDYVVDVFALIGGDNADFTVTTDCPVSHTVRHNEICTAAVVFHPQATGPRATELSTLMDFRGVQGDFRYSITGIGVNAESATPVDVVEYYNATLDHYFITWVPVEQANLDAGNTPTRWTRTGYSFNAYTSAQAGTSPVCRYYIPPGLGDSHFFGRGTAECDATGAAHPTFVLEDPAFMQVVLPVSGTCPAGTTPVYRVFSNRPDANHRYMTDRAVRDDMVVRGWLAEGDGPDLVVMCAV